MSANPPTPPSPANTRIPFWRQLRWNLIVYAVILAVAPVAVVGYLTIAQVRTNTVTQDEAELQAVATLKEAEISAWLNSGNLVLDTFVSNPLVQTQLLQFATTEGADPARVNSLLSSFVEAGPE